MHLDVQCQRAAAFRRLHEGPDILVLPNAWDVASALLFQAAGFPAVGTTSLGIAVSLGYPDGERISRAEMLQAVGRIAGRVSVPLTADVEAGYGPSTHDVAETIKCAIAAGAVGVNLEDGTPDLDSPLRDVSEQQERLRAAREAASAAGVPVFVNARTDVFLRSVGAPDDRVEHAARRGRAYLEAGADGVFVPGVTDADVLSALVHAIPGPVNVLAAAGTPPVRTLQQLGVRRVSLGPGPVRAALAVVRRVARELQESGTYDAFVGDAVPYADLKVLLEGSPADA